MDYADETSTSIYHDTVSTGGGAAFPQDQLHPRSVPESVNFTSESSLIVDLPSAVSEKDRVVFTIHTKTTLEDFNECECSVERTHDEFVWLYEYLVSHESYAGFIVPPVPSRPNFDSSRAKLQQLSANEGNIPQKELQKLKSELEAEYLASFKKTVAMHELFLQRLASHPTFRHDHNFRVFLEHKGPLNIRNKTRKEKAVDIFRSVSKTADEMIRLANQRDEDSFFQEEKGMLAAYFNAVKDGTVASTAVNKHRKGRAESLLRVSLALDSLVPKECSHTHEPDYVLTLAAFFENYGKLQSRLLADEDLKFTDTLRYYTSDAAAAKDLLYRRIRALADYEAANRALDKARSKVKDVQAAEDAQMAAIDRFKSISESARLELKDFKVRRINYFQKNLTDLAELEAKHAKAHIELINSTLQALKKVEISA